MRKYLAFLFLVCCSLSCKDKQPADIIAEVNSNCKKINSSLADYKLRTVDDITHPAGGTINGYYRDEEVKKVIAEHFSDTCRTFTEAYFDDGMLIFIEEQNFVYNLPITCTEEVARAKGDSVWYDDKLTKLEISRYYFDDNKLIKWVLPGGREVSNKTSDFINRESGLWAETVVLLKQLKEE